MNQGRNTVMKKSSNAGKFVTFSNTSHHN